MSNLNNISNIAKQKQSMASKMMGGALDTAGKMARGTASFAKNLVVPPKTPAPGLGQALRGAAQQRMK